MRTTSTLACLLMATALAIPPAHAQQSTETTPQQNASQSQCYDELGAFSQRMNEEGFPVDDSLLLLVRRGRRCTSGCAPSIRWHSE